MLPSIVNQLGPEGFASLRKLAMEKVGEETAARGAAVVKDDDVPDLEGDFEEVAKVEEQASKVNILE
jgi:nascent polypeptide-associated complex subunit beta